SKGVVVIPQCLAPGSDKTIPGGYSGVKLVTTYSTDAADPEVKLFNAAMSTYAPNTQIVDVTSGGFAVVLGFARAMSGLTSGDVTPATVKSTLAAMPPQPLPLASGLTFQCNGKLVAIAPSECSTGALLATL